MCNNVNTTVWKIREDHTYVQQWLWKIVKDCERYPPEGNTEGSAVFCGKAQPTWGRNRCWFYLEIIKTEKGENKHSVEETEGQQQNIIGIILCKKSPILLKIWEIILRLKVFGKRKHSPKDRCIALAVNFWFLAVCQFLQFFLKFTFCFYQAW